MTYKKGDTVKLNDRGNITLAVVVKDGVDAKGKVRVRPNGFPFDVSVTTEPNNDVYLIKNT